MKPRVKTALVFAGVGAIVGAFIGSNPDNVLGLIGAIVLGAVVAFVAGLFWD